MNPSTLWILETTESHRFPYRLRIRKEGKTLLCLRVQDRWPGPKGQIFCIRSEDEEDLPMNSVVVERVPVVSLSRYGKRLAVVLDRAVKKRCDFLFLKKPYKQQEGEYEQIFWRTQRSLTARRPRVKLTARGDTAIQVAIDTHERYPWKFTGCRVTRENLPVGDYALRGEKGLVAVVERKSMENLLGHFGNLPLLHQALGELEAYEHAALVVEAGYPDFLSEKRIKPYRPSFAAKAIAELYALHPHLHIVLAGNRKLANEWTIRFFGAIESHEKDISPSVVRDAAAAYGNTLPFRGGGYYEAIEMIEEMPATFTFAMVREAVPGVPETTIRRALRHLKNEGRIVSHRAGIKSY